MTPVILWLNDLRNRIAILRAGIEVCAARSSLLAVKNYFLFSLHIERHRIIFTEYSKIINL
ncbi:hypothetical protein BUQ74_04485 [Leptospira weilii serovar Heyan]|nr:hypothetical protein BUQ74_04485 [Leptospira weilii serovar Heyan]QDK21919.1 hypothetical protein FHG67_03570 [Leptospira weilii]QDK25858.1 hypothetical protein FHG68_03425 [Leptospira weilii]